MSAARETAMKILLPPTFDYLPGVFLPDLERARRAARIVHAVGAARRAGARLGLDLGRAGRTAPETAACVAAEGWRRAAVSVGTPDDVGGRILRDSLEAVGVSVQWLAGEAQIHADPGREGAGPGSPEAAPFAASDDLSEAWLVGPPELDLPAEADVFRETGSGRLERTAPGSRVVAPRTVTAIRLVPADEGAVDLGAKAGDDVMHVLTLPDEPDALLPPDRFDALFAAGEVRLHFGAPAPPAVANEGAPWAYRFRLHEPEWRRRLRTLVARWWPARRSWFEAVVGWYDHGIDPLEEMYAGNNLADRNPELLVNIVP